MNFVQLVIRQPVTVTVGVILIIMTGLIALQRIPIQLTPNVEDTIIAVSTFWEGASPEEIEREIVEKQEERLQGLANLRSMTSTSQQGQGQIRLEFLLGTEKEVALREVSDKLREVPDYPENVDEPIVFASDPWNRDFIAWIIFGSTDENLEIRTLQDFADDRIKPVLERIDGMSEIGVLGGYERETQIRFDPYRLAQYGITPTQLITALRESNRNISGGELQDAKFNVRLRTIGQYESVQDVEETIITYTDAGPVYVGDIAEVVESYKEAFNFVRSKGRPVIAINAQKEIGSNVMQVMDGLKREVARLNEPGNVLDTESRRLGLNGKLTLDVVYDQTIYINDALALVRNNIWLGGSLAILVLIIFLRSVRTVGIIALAIPISVIGAVTVMTAMGRTVNVVSLAGMAFAIGLVVDNAIVVLENIFRHIEMGKRALEAAYDGTREVWGAVLASTLTTILVFVPILLIQEEAGQLFRDISLAICAAVALSLLVSITVIPTSAARILRERTGTRSKTKIGATLHAIPDLIARIIYKLCGSVMARLAVVLILTFGSLVGAYFIMPPADYLPQGNRNLVFGLLISPPGYNVEEQIEIGKRIEKTIRPYWEAATNDGHVALPTVPTFNWMTQSPGDPITPPPLTNYFFVGFDGIMFHGAICDDPTKVVDVLPLFQHATRQDVLPGMMAFAFQVPLFQLGGSTGSAINIDFTGDDLEQVSQSATAVMMELFGRHGAGTVQPSPSNYDIYGPELRVVPNKRRLADLGMTPSDLGLFARAAGDGAIIGEYRIRGDSIDLKLIAKDAVDRKFITNLEDTPVATPAGYVVPMNSLADFERVVSPPQINHVGRQRSITLLFTPPQGLPLDRAISEVEGILSDFRANGTIPPSVGTGFAGSASKLASVMRALLGDGTILGTLSSSLILALIVVYLLMCVLFQSFIRPLVIMFSIPPATLGGFMGLFIIYIWSMTDRYLPIQTMDVLTMLGFVILIGIVVNNAILIVHQAINFMEGKGDTNDGTRKSLPPREAIAEAVRTRVRPIFMSTLTSVGGMLPLVLMPGAGSELYRGLGSVVVGGLLISTIFTLFLVPTLFSLVTDAQMYFRRAPSTKADTVPTGAVPAGVRRHLRT